MSVYTVGCADFVPARLKQDGFMSSGEFEPLHQVVGKAQMWLQQNPSLNLVNVQTIDYKLKSTYGKFNIFLNFTSLL